MSHPLLIRENLLKEGIYLNWQVSPGPFSLSDKEISLIRDLGSCLYEFYRASNKLYYESVHGRQPPWVHEYLDQGKPWSLIEYSRMKRMKNLLPGIIRPDLILTEDGMVATELDSVPGGIGITGCLQKVYFTSQHGQTSQSPRSLGGQSLKQTHPGCHCEGREAISRDMDYPVAGGSNSMVDGFWQMLCHAAGIAEPVVAIIVSEESRDYKPEMEWLSRELRELGREVYTISPEEVTFTEDGLWLDRGKKKIDVVYRFFELFDLKNIPKAELIMYSAKKKKVVVTPPFKPFLEEKLLYALFHHPLLKDFWVTEMGEPVYNILYNIIPGTWVLDPSPMPPYGIIPGLKKGSTPVASWMALASATQKERRFVIKPSGFSELAWGSRGVVVGHDVSRERWKEALEKALRDFEHTPYILQTYHKGRHVEVEYIEEDGSIKRMEGRVRLCPYYFVTRDGVSLGGIMATICALDKKVIHGMEDAVITVCAS